MSNRAIQFLNHWATEHVNAIPYPEHLAEAQRLAKECVADAHLRLGGDPADDEYPDKPPRMRWATYNRLIGCPRGTVARENKPEGQRTRPQQVQPDDDKREMARLCSAGLETD
jgi:hypothetical protein